ncbi:MAG: lytic transglycosylase domain-containing protein, partial [Mobilitalea sp.]
MSEVNGIASIDTTNNYNINSSKKTSESGSNFASYLGESKSMDAIFDEAAQKYNVPVELLKAVGKAESSFNASAVSKCGAQGVMQLMPATAKELGVADSFDAEQNINGGAKYISGLLKKYDGDTTLALAAYNAGSGNVKKYGGVPPFEETQNYVKKVLKFMGQDITTGVTTKTASTTTNNNATAKIAQSIPTSTATTKYQYLTPAGTDTTAAFELGIDDIFSYEDYMKFLDIFLNDDDEEEEEKQNYDTTSKDTATVTASFSSAEI